MLHPSLQKGANEQTAYLHKGLFTENIFQGLASIQSFLLYYIFVTKQHILLDDSRSANKGSLACGKTGKYLNTCLKFPSCVIKLYKLNREGFKFPSFKNFTFLKHRTTWLNKVPSSEGIFVIRLNTPQLREYFSVCRMNMIRWFSDMGRLLVFISVGFFSNAQH